MEENWKRSAPFLAMVILTASFFAAPNMPGTGEVKGIGSPPFSIHLNESKQNAYVAPGQDGIVVFHGFIHQEQYQNRTVLFELETYCNGWETTTPGPFSALLNRSYEIPFEIMVKVPERTSQSSSGYLSVSCRFEFIGNNLSGRIGPAMGLIFIKPYMDCTASPQILNLSLHRDESYEVEFNLTNTGNCDNRMRIEISNRHDLEDKNLVCLLYRDKYYLWEGNSTQVAVSVNTSMDTNLGDHKIIIRFVYGHSMCGQEYREAIINVKVMEKELFGVSLSVWIILEGVLIGVVGIIIANATIIRDIRRRVL
jgi:hypothetical protein